jgi:glutamyl-tRNA reductase
LENKKVPHTLFAFGLNHNTAPVEVREKLYLHEDEIPQFLRLVQPHLAECLVVSTCNRTEVYAVTGTADLDIQYFKDALVDFKGARGIVEDEYFFELISCSACQQLFSVATSIDSKVIGDLQILRQLRSAYSIAREQRTAGKILNQLLQRAFKIGKLTFTETAIHEGAVSTSLAAVELAAETFGSLRGLNVLVLGAGETARLAAEALLNKRVGTLLVSNRTRKNAEDLMDALERSATRRSVVDFDKFRDRLGSVDIVISSTGSELPILNAKDFRGSGNHRVLVLDIAVPRDVSVEVGQLPNVVLKNIDDLHSIVNENHERRLRDLPRVKKLISQEMADFLTWYYTLPLMPAYEKTRCRPAPDRTLEILRTKEFLSRNASEIHKLFAGSKGDFKEDLDNHLALVRRLQEKRALEAGLSG